MAKIYNLVFQTNNIDIVSIPIECDENSLRLCKTLHNTVSTVGVGENNEITVAYAIDVDDLQFIIDYCKLFMTNNNLSINDDIPDVPKPYIKDNYENIPQRYIPPIPEWEQTFIKPILNDKTKLLKIMGACFFLLNDHLKTLLVRIFVRQLLTYLDTNKGSMFEFLGYQPGTTIDSIHEEVKKSVHETFQFLGKHEQMMK